jgi:PIN domain nuclease of toxin-antitoxin system
MRLLLDTHSLVWSVDNPEQLSPGAHAALSDSSVKLFVSAASIWELAIKLGLGKMSLSLPYSEWMTLTISDLGATILPVSVDHANAIIQLPFHHRDPFDRLLVAQSLTEDLPLVSCDGNLDAYGIHRFW